MERKLPDDSDLTVFKDRPYDFIPSSKKVPAPGKEYFRLSGEPVLLDVIEASYKPMQLDGLPRPGMVLQEPKKSGEVDRCRRLDPLVGGISIGSPQVPVGTLGALVWDNTDGSVCILSNWHVLAGDFKAEVGTPCFQPGVFDQGRSTDVVARLKRWSFNRQTDAAIAELTGSRHYSTGEILSMFQTIKASAKPYLGMTVRKSGRSTGFTWGFIDGLYFSAAIEYGGGVVRVFEEQIHIAPLEKGKRISEPGDSGSVWVTNDPYEEGYLAVGLHFAGDLPHSAFGEYALANPMRIVEERLNFSFRPLFLEIRDEDVLSRLTVQSQQNGTGAEPVGLIRGGTLTGPGGQPDPAVVGETQPRG
jgi:hypothetical protein